MPSPSEIPTPPFVAWALAADCIYRDEADCGDPSRVEQVLRPLRSAAEAIADGRCFDGLCVRDDWQPDTPIVDARGFVIDDTLVPFGGIDAANRTCGHCPANVAMAPEAKPRWGGCHGLLIAYDLQTLAGKVEAEWYRLWMNSPLTEPDLQLHSNVWSRVNDVSSIISGTNAYRRALEVALNSQAASLKLYVKSYPGGLRSGRTWHVPSHCRRCGIERLGRTRECPMCGSADGVEPARTRKARGERPYWPIVQFLGEKRAEEFLARYEQHRITEP